MGLLRVISQAVKISIFFLKFPDRSLKVLVQEGQQVSAGTVLFTIDDSVQKANVELAQANLKVAQDQYDKDLASWNIDPKSISKMCWIPRKIPLTRQQLH